MLEYKPFIGISLYTSLIFFDNDTKWFWLFNKVLKILSFVLFKFLFEMDFCSDFTLIVNDVADQIWLLYIFDTISKIEKKTQNIKKFKKNLKNFK